MDHSNAHFVVCMLAAWVCAPGLTVAGGAEPDFDREVAPILASRCLECHCGAEAKGKLDLSREEAARRGGESGPAFVAGQLEASAAWQRIEADEMPPKHPLAGSERVVLEAWITRGAKWGTDPIDPFRITTGTRAGYDWWSLQQVTRPEPPAVKNAQWAINPIDRFVLARMEAQGLSPSPRADDLTLVRRLTFDLVGLPPSPEELRSGDTYGQIVERLLASPHYGVRWARHWLDVAHFGESDGFEYDRMRPHAWRYRDWVIEALNRDMPYDEFARLQIAGDLLPSGDEGALTATGFLVGGAHDSLLPKGEVMQLIMRQDELEDVVGLVSQTFLGLTVNCARCHDHKFDPVRQTDYFRLAAALAGVKRGNRGLAPLAPPAELTARLAEGRKELATIEERAREVALAKRPSHQVHSQMPPQPMACWEFNGDLRDSVGGLHGNMHGRARFDRGLLVVEEPDGYVTTAPLDRDLTAKTLEVWLRSSKPEQRGGAAISLQTLDGKEFDAIVYGEKEPRRWIAGSNNFRRTQAIAGGSDETEVQRRLVHLAMVYHEDGTIAAYRDGRPYGQPYQSSGPLRFRAGSGQISFGLRHSPASPGKILTAKIDRAALYDRALSAEEVAASAVAGGLAVTEEELVAQLGQAERGRRTDLQAELRQLEEKLEPYRNRQVYAVMPQPAPVVKLFARGNVQEPREVVAPGGIEALAISGPDFGLAPNAPEEARRKKLASWIASEQNPLFARTIVNRVWQYHFGRGLVETPNDLGFSGGAPSHSELLDWLASELVARKWSLKELHKLIVSSATYQQLSLPRDEALAVDADNRWLWRYSPRRLEAECVRDSMLSAAGELNLAMGGASYFDVRPYVYKSAQFYEPLDPEGAEFQRRSIYRFSARGGRNPLLDTFDCPDPSVTAPRRPSTTTPLQALALFNNSFTLRMADRFAERLKREAEGPEQQVRRAFAIAYGRPPSEVELNESVEFTGKHGLAAFCRVLLNSNGFLYVN